MRMRGKRVAHARRVPFGVADLVCILLGVVLLLLVLLVAVVPKGMGFTPYAVTSMSMEPALRRGDLLFVGPIQLEQVEVGDIVTFRAGAGILTHRVYEIDPAGALRTKADGLNRLDPEPVTEENLLGKAVYKLPLLGYLTVWSGGEEAAE